MTSHPAESDPTVERLVSPEELAIRTLTETVERAFAENDFSTEPSESAINYDGGVAAKGVQDRLFDMKTWTTVTRNTSETGDVSYGFWAPGQASSDRTGSARTWRPGASSIIDVRTSDLNGLSDSRELASAQIEAMVSRINEVFPPKVVEPKNIVLRTLRKFISGRKSNHRN